jgi:hypothetical protein
MQWSFSWGWFFGGIAIAVAGLLMVRFHRQIADNLANGVSSYDKIKLWGVVAIIGGFVCMANLHTLILAFIISLFMPGK